jgi:hypothetical protein
VRSHKRRLAPRAWAALAWGLGCFLAAQLALNLALEWWRPELRDPEYGVKLKVLRRLQARAGGRPLVVVLGSSRVQMGLRAGDLTAAEPDAAVFNFGMVGAGPVAELLHLRRLLADGVRPDCLVIEVLSPLLRMHGQGDALGTDRLAWGDLGLMRRYATHPRDLSARWWEGRLLPCYSCRFRVLSRYAPFLPSWSAGAANPYALAAGQDPSGWLPYPYDAVTAERYAHDLAVARGQYQPLLTDFRIDDGADRALREMLELCRQEGITAALLLMPEGTDFRNLYPPAARGAIDTYLGRLRQEYGVPLIDAREWVEDDGFWDSHHLTKAGAAAFTRRFGREALRPLLQGRRDETTVAASGP